jgi:hypothetical protein
MNVAINTLNSTVNECNAVGRKIVWWGVFH